MSDCNHSWKALAPLPTPRRGSTIWWCKECGEVSEEQLDQQPDCCNCDRLREKIQELEWERNEFIWALRAANTRTRQVMDDWKCWQDRLGKAMERAGVEWDGEYMTLPVSRSW